MMNPNRVAVKNETRGIAAGFLPGPGSVFSAGISIVVLNM
jgi:hypothetical protein